MKARRILTAKTGINFIPNYAKVLDGTIISKQIGIDAMLAACEHFREWVAKIKALIK